MLVSHREDIIAFDISENLRELWVFPSEGVDKDDIDAIYGTPVVSDGILYVPTYDGKLFAIDMDDGTPVWPEAFEADGALVGGVAVENGVAYFGDSAGDLYAVDIETGEEAWPRFETGEEIWSTPVLFGGELFVTSLDGRLYAIDPATGEELWSFKTDAGVAATPVIDAAAGQIIVGSFDQKLRAIDLETHNEVWSVSGKNWFWATPLLNAGTVFAPSLDSKVYAVDSATGDEAWQAFGTKGEIKASPVIASGTLFVADRDGFVYGIDPATGEEAFPAPLELADAVLADPLVIELDGDTLIAIVTTGGEFYLIDSETLQLVRQFNLSG